ncbi:MAG: 50S ribosomal protein L3 [candidate division KSB1 bacterium]|nr:50S ribosomal protein L3 [candidate division KSB1 bacterium]MDZ7366064.1 50S ribosomal protein L3 [candidate division KSB1 bacterium]MDZ7404294.1 50S ribosomal protein L3 [candidate division KSB1 bacterium]
MSGLIGRKLGMTRIFDEKGNEVQVSVIQTGPCYVTEIRTKDRHGYDALQLGFEEKRDKSVKKPERGHFAKSGVKPMRLLREFRTYDVSQFKLGDAIKADIFQVGDKVKVSGISKGKGFQGVVKRHHFGGGPVTHGQSDRTRAPGSLGGSSYPSRVLKGLRMAGRMGGDRVTVRNMKVVRVDVENNIVMVRGGIPGAKNGMVVIQK